MAAYGAEFELTPRTEGMKGSMAKAEELRKKIGNAWIPSQFVNPANPRIHMETTSKEIMKDFPDGLDYVITGVGTGGHISGVAKILKEKWPELKVFAVEPDAAPVISGGEPGPHPIQGIGAGFIPENLYKELLDGVIRITREEAYTFTRRAAREEGLFMGISSGASLAAVNKKIKDIPKNSKILTFNYDTGERYLSVDDLYG